MGSIVTTTAVATNTVITDKMTVDNIENVENMENMENMDNVTDTEKEIIDRLAFIESETTNKPTENEEVEFDKLQSMLSYLTSKSTNQLDIVLEAITYINMLQDKLLQNIQVRIIESKYAKYMHFVYQSTVI